MTSELARALSSRLEDPRRLAYYALVGEFCLKALDALDAHPVVVGVNGPQGCGKTSLVSHLVGAFDLIGVRAAAASIDDFYLTHAEQQALAARHPGDRTLEHRGYPGTHDVELGTETIAGLKQGLRTLVPAYDKSANGGRGDRAPASSWRTIEPPLDLVLIEGWMLGFEPVDDAALAPELRATNELLRGYAPWNALLDTFVTLEALSLDHIVAWRIDAERTRRERGETALSNDAARDYVERFLPAYRAYAAGVRAPRPERPSMSLVLGPDRLPLP